MSKASKNQPQGFPDPLKRPNGEFQAAAPGWTTPDEEEDEQAQVSPLVAPSDKRPQPMTRRERRGDDYPYYEFSVDVDKRFGNSQARNASEWGPIEIVIDGANYANKSDFLNRALGNYIEKNKILLEQPVPEKPPMVRRRMRKGLSINSLYYLVSNYYFIGYREPFAHIVKFKPTIREAFNEAVYDLLMHHKDILIAHGVDVDKLPTYPLQQP